MVKKVNPEEKAAQFQEWKDGPEIKVLLKFWNELDRAGGEVKACDNAFVDIVDDWQPIMNILFEICEVYKVPGRKAKCKLQFKVSPTPSL